MKYTWLSCTGSDTADIVRLAQLHFEQEIDLVFEPDPIAYARNLMLATVNQYYNPGSELLQVCRDPGGSAVWAYVWAVRGQRAPWSDEEMVTVKMVHVDLDLPVRTRIELIHDMIDLWEHWAVQNHIPIVCSTTMRRETQGFMQIHQRRGYDVRGSYAYRRLVQSAVQHPD